MTQKDLYDLMHSLHVRAYRAREAGRAMFFVTPQERSWLYNSPYLSDEERRGHKYLGVDVEVVDYELPVDERMAYPRDGLPRLWRSRARETHTTRHMP